MRLREDTGHPRQVEFNRPYPLNEGHRTAPLSSPPSVRVLLPCSLIGRSREGNESNLGSVTDSNLELLSMTCKEQGRTTDGRTARLLLHHPPRARARAYLRTTCPDPRTVPPPRAGRAGTLLITLLPPPKPRSACFIHGRTRTRSLGPLRTLMS